VTDPLTQTFAALADPTRRAILAQIVSSKSLTVNGIVAGQKLSQPAISKHLKVLENARLIRKVKRAKTRSCTINGEGFAVARDWIETYRAFWEGAFGRIDQLIIDLQYKEQTRD